jgi:hypothetical protein
MEGLVNKCREMLSGDMITWKIKKGEGWEEKVKLQRGISYFLQLYLLLMCTSYCIICFVCLTEAAKHLGLLENNS